MKSSILYIILILMLSSIASAQENSTASNQTPEKIQGTKAVVVIDTNNRTGYFTYKEEYYTVSKNNSLQFEDGRIFYKGNISTTNITLRIIRPLDRNGNPYNEAGIKAIATLDNKTILSQFYKRRIVTNESNNIKENGADPSDKKSPGFGLGILSIAVICFAILAQKRHRRN